MKTTIRWLIALAFAFCLSAVASPRDLTGQWDLKIEDKGHHVVTALVIQFTDQRAPSCIGGNWFRVNVVSSTTDDAHFFPVSDPLSYSVDGNQITIGRNEICDAYLELRGPLNAEAIRGEYISFGWGSTPLGFFALSRKK